MTQRQDAGIIARHGDVCFLPAPDGRGYYGESAVLVSLEKGFIHMDNTPELRRRAVVDKKGVVPVLYVLSGVFKFIGAKPQGAVGRHAFGQRACDLDVYICADNKK